MTASQVHLMIAGLFGALGVGLWAYATHAGQPSGAIAAQMLLIHAGALVALTAARRADLLPGRAAVFLISVLAFGVILFSGDLAMRALAGQRLFPMASPLGGVLMMAGWLGLAVLPLLRRGA
ncbi:MAG: DUF423 domain-containing protein [Beijerinckiaceae bacterium]|jgi:uncharacterized membrane protein YgdD (TMEM256/DUF423 family)|nr:DUF423 domain-containing protein [Beijerinckiaceae bacterium]